MSVMAVDTSAGISMLTVFVNEGIKMDKCPKNMTLVALNIFGLIKILDFFQDTFVSILKLKDPQIILLFFSFLLRGGQAYFYIFVFGLLGSTTGRGPHFLALSIPLILCNRGCKVFKCTEFF